MPDEEKQSISKYNGYYLGRYEAGDAESTKNKVFRTEASSNTARVAIKKGQTPYNCSEYNDYKRLAEGIANIENYKGLITKITSSYAWDTALMFIQNKIPDYATNSIQGNYRNQEFEYINLAGQVTTKKEGESVFIPTGQTTPVCNIYDMGGNVWEYTSELISYENNGYPYSIRGGGSSQATEISQNPEKAYYGMSGLRVEYGHDGLQWMTFRPAMYLIP